MYLLKLDVINMWLVTLPLGLLAAYVLHLPPLAVYMVLNLDEVYKIAVMAKRYRSRAWVRNLTKKEWAPPGRYENEMRGEILRRMPLGVMVISASGRVSLANPAAAELLGRDLADIEGSNYVELFMQDGENAEFADLAIEAVSDKLVTHEGIVSYRGEGGVTRIHVKSSFLEDEDCRLGVCLMLSRAE